MGLSYQRQPGTLVLIDLPQLDPNPFDAEPADPIALVPARLTAFTTDAVRALRSRLPLRTPPEGTVRWQTPGLDPAVADVRAWRADRGHTIARPYQRPVDTTAARIDRRGGLLVCSATASLLRSWAVAVAQLGDYWYRGMDYTPLDIPPQYYCGPDGEVQVFRDYRQRVAATRRARGEVLAAQQEPLDPEQLAPLIWARAEAVRSRG